VPEFVETTVKDIDEQLRQLRDEVSRLEAARSALTGGRRRPGRRRGSATRAVGARTTSPGATRTRSTRSQASGTRTGRSTSTSRTRSTRGARNTRAAQALELVRQRPGITVPEIAEAMKIQPNYLYRVLPRLASDGQVKRNGQGWHPAS
jgi:hypothetical protein